MFFLQGVIIRYGQLCQDFKICYVHLHRYFYLKCLSQSHAYGQITSSNDRYLVSRRKGVMLHLAFRLAVTPLGVDVAWCMLRSSNHSTITDLIIPGHSWNYDKEKQLRSSYSLLACICHVGALSWRTYTITLAANAIHRFDELPIGEKLKFSINIVYF